MELGGPIRSFWSARCCPPPRTPPASVRNGYRITARAIEMIPRALSANPRASPTMAVRGYWTRTESPVVRAVNEPRAPKSKGLESTDGGRAGQE